MFELTRRNFLKILAISAGGMFVGNKAGQYVAEKQTEIEAQRKLTKEQLEKIIQKYDTLILESKKYHLVEKYKKLYGDEFYYACPEVFWLHPQFCESMEKLKSMDQSTPEPYIFWNQHALENSYYLLQKMGVLQKAPKYNTFPTYNLNGEPERKEDFEIIIRKIATILKKTGLTKLPWKIQIEASPGEKFSPSIVGYFSHPSSNEFEVQDGVLVGSIFINDKANVTPNTNSQAPDLFYTIIHELFHSLDIINNTILFRFYSPEEICKLISLQCDGFLQDREDRYPNSNTISFFDEYHYPEYVYMTLGEDGYVLRNEITRSDIKTKMLPEAEEASKTWEYQQSQSIGEILSNNIRNFAFLETTAQNSKQWLYLIHRIQEHREITNGSLQDVAKFLLIKGDARQTISQLFIHLMHYFLITDIYFGTLPDGILTSEEEKEMKHKMATLLRRCDTELFAEQGRYHLDQTIKNRMNPDEKHAVLEYLKILGIIHSG